MAWTAPRTWVVGEIVTAAIQNTHVRDNFTAVDSSFDRLLAQIAEDDAGAGATQANIIRSVSVTVNDTADKILALGAKWSVATRIDHIRDNTAGVNGATQSITPTGGNMSTSVPMLLVTTPAVGAHTIQFRSDDAGTTAWLLAWVIPNNV